MSSSQQSTYRTSFLCQAAARDGLHSTVDVPLPQFDSYNSRVLVGNEELIGNSTVGEQLTAPLQPFFALVEDLVTSEHHHPTVHYVFADDDPEVIAQAACCALVQDGSQHLEDDHTLEPQAQTSKLAVLAGDIQEHFILVDIEPCQTGHGYTVARAHSLSSRWQVQSTTIANAPTIDRSAVDSSEGLMLKIEGRGAVFGPDSDWNHTKKEKETLPQLVKRFEQGLTEIRAILSPQEES